jgi:hypothetical protein
MPDGFSLSGQGRGGPERAGRMAENYLHFNSIPALWNMFTIKVNKAKSDPYEFASTVGA